MKIQMEPGVYVVAVSGGVDSMALLNMLTKIPGFTLTVAHFDHGIRSDSDADRKLVESTAKKYGLKFVYKEGKLGPNASEAKARKARYEFLNSVAKDVGADAIITAHHRDDLLETAIINLLRGTGRKGLSSLNSRTDIIRPLLDITKEDINKYAEENKIVWREDSTNTDIFYLRNYVRHKILPKFSKQQKQQLLAHIDNLNNLNADIDTLISDLIHTKDLDRQMFIDLNHSTSLEVMASWLRKNGVTEFDSKRLELLVRGSKTLAPGKKLDIDKTHHLKVSKKDLTIIS